MKRSSKISLIIVSILVAFVAAVIITIDSIATYAVHRELKQMPLDSTMSLSVGHLHIAPLAQTLLVHDVTFSLKNDSVDVSLSLPFICVNHIDIKRAVESKGQAVLLKKLILKNATVCSAFPHPEGVLELNMENLDLEVRGITYSNGVDSTLREGVTVDSIYTHPGLMALHLTKQHPPKKPYGTPQEGFAKMPIPLMIHHIKTVLDRFEFALTTPIVKYSKLSIANASADIMSVSNDKDNKMITLAYASLLPSGRAYINMALRQNKLEEVALDLLVVGAKGSMADELVRPMVGITAAVDVDTLHMNIHGNKNHVQGDFVMRYHDLEVTAHPGESPYEVINKNAGAITFFGNMLLPHANPNPLTPDNIRRYHVEGERNVMQPYPLFLVWPMVDGLKDTLLPGLFVNKRIKTAPNKPTTKQDPASRHYHVSKQ